MSSDTNRASPTLLLSRADEYDQASIQAREANRSRVQSIQQDFRANTAANVAARDAEGASNLAAAGWSGLKIAAFATEYQTALGHERQRLDQRYGPERDAMSATASSQTDAANADLNQSLNVIGAKRTASADEVQATVHSNVDLAKAITAGANHEELAAYQDERKAGRAKGVADLTAQISVARASNDERSVRDLSNLRRSEYGAEDPNTHQFTGGLDQAQTDAGAKRIVEEEEAEKTRLTAEGAANRQRITHDAFAAEITSLQALKQVAETTGDVATRAARVGAIQSQIELANQQQREVVQGTVASLGTQRQTNADVANRDPFAAQQDALKGVQAGRFARGGGQPVEDGRCHNSEPARRIAPEHGSAARRQAARRGLRGPEPWRPTRLPAANASGPV